ncbi:MAG: AAA family ATPase [Acidimicrobiia bacterium]|nr:AAA family ATPase [Acidimicrobiia bacterium]
MNPTDTEFDSTDGKSGLDEIVERRGIVITCGTGGVGKTTTAAVLALEAARRGRNVAVVTIDPAKRLASTLGLDELTNAPREIDRARWDPAGRGTQQGRLSALMLDTKTTFDDLVTANAETPTRPSAFWTTASTGTSPERSRARRSTWPPRSCTNCTPPAGTTSSSSTLLPRDMPSISSMPRSG